MQYLYPAALILLIISALANKKKTIKALSSAAKKFLNILPSFLTMIALLGIFTLIIPIESVGDILSQHTNWLGLLIALFVGSIVFVPGFIAYPLSAVLLQKGVPYYIIAGFTTCLMLVGFASLPVEITYFGKKIAITRNIAGFIIALIISLIVGIIYREF